MKKTIQHYIFAATVTFAILSATSVMADRGDWFPSEWGVDDQKGSVNRLSEEKVIQAVKLIKTGRVYQLGRTYEADMPMFGNRHFSLRILEVGPFAKNQLTAHEGYMTGELDQVGTQFDGLGHVGVGDQFFNGFSRDEISTITGLTSLGVENVGPIVTRGVLIDIPAYKEVESLEPGYEISVDDITGALEKQGTQIGEGDVVLIHTGWGKTWNSDPDSYYGPGPGIGLPAAEYLATEKIVMVGSDNAGVEVVPNPDPELAFPVHQFLLAENGIYLIESIVTEKMANDGVYEFAFVFAPLRLKGASGSPGNPVAIY